MRSVVYVGLSGGVDSAVSAALLQRQGYDVVGVFIRIALAGYPCPAAKDRQDAMRVAAHLRIPFKEIDLSEAYRERVFAHTMSEFGRGRTPNPDALCNREIKFGLLYDWAKRNGADFVATGHYARVAKKGSSVELFEGVDQSKDQSYFLWMVPEEHLAHSLFPIGALQKSEVRSIAEKLKLPNAQRKDSQGLCFLGDITLHDMLERELRPSPGRVLSQTGDIVGTHDGVAHYTLGQRHGFTLTTHNTQTKPHYVVEKDTAQNTIVVSEDKFPLNATSTRITLTEMNWIGSIEDGQYEARYRYHGQRIRCTLSRLEGEVVLHEPHYVAQGQSLVLYKGERCVGGGTIDTSRVC